MMFIMFWAKWGKPVDRVNHVNLSQSRGDGHTYNSKWQVSFGSEFAELLDINHSPNAPFLSCLYLATLRNAKLKKKMTLTTDLTPKWPQHKSLSHKHPSPSHPSPSRPRQRKLELATRLQNTSIKFYLLIYHFLTVLKAQYVLQLGIFVVGLLVKRRHVKYYTWSVVTYRSHRDSNVM